MSRRAPGRCWGSRTRSSSAPDFSSQAEKLTRRSSVPGDKAIVNICRARGDFNERVSSVTNTCSIGWWLLGNAACAAPRSTVAPTRYCCGACRQKAYRARVHLGRRSAMRAQAAAARQDARKTRERAQALRQQSAQARRESLAARIAATNQGIRPCGRCHGPVPEGTGLWPVPWLRAAVRLAAAALTGC